MMENESETPDEIDLDDDHWVRRPEQIARGEAARLRLAQGKEISHDELRRQLDLLPDE